MYITSPDSSILLHKLTQNSFYAIKNRLVNRTILVSIVILPKGGSIDRRLIKWLHCVLFAFASPVSIAR